MELRKRVKLSELEDNLGLSKDASAVKWRTARSNATLEGVRGDVSLLGGSGICSGSDVLLCCPWQRCVSMASGLLLAGLLALTQAWCVNGIHENLLWFSQLTVGVITCNVDTVFTVFNPILYKTRKLQSMTEY